MQATTDEDRELITRIQSGEIRVFAHFYSKYYDYIFNYILRRVKFNFSLTEDLASDVFLRAMSAIHRFDSNTNFEAWITTISRNIIADYYKSSRTKRELAIFDPELDDIIVEESPHIRRAIIDALKALPKDQRDVLVWRFFADMDAREIAPLVGKRDDNSVRATQLRAIRNLRKYFQE